MGIVFARETSSSVREAKVYAPDGNVNEKRIPKVSKKKLADFGKECFCDRC